MPLSDTHHENAQLAAEVVSLLGGRWTLEVLCAMCKGPVRLSDLKRTIPAASKKGITASLRTLQSAGIAIRTDLSTSVLHVEYALADGIRKPMVDLLTCLLHFSSIFGQR